jgi:hypothetical protein
MRVYVHKRAVWEEGCACCPVRSAQTISPGWYGEVFLLPLSKASPSVDWMWECMQLQGCDQLQPLQRLWVLFLLQHPDCESLPAAQACCHCISGPSSVSAMVLGSIS